MIAAALAAGQISSKSFKPSLKGVVQGLGSRGLNSCKAGYIADYIETHYRAYQVRGILRVWDIALAASVLFGTVTPQTSTRKPGSDVP